LPALPTLSPPPGAWLTWGSSCSRGGGSPGSRLQPCLSFTGRNRSLRQDPRVPLPPDPDRGTQSRGSSGKSLSKSHFQGTRNVIHWA
ncbi:hypothetical protein HispidOSU_030728, partial [Sigmodon hispidus]